jgi:hypothetical protein
MLSQMKSRKRSNTLCIARLSRRAVGTTEPLFRQKSASRDTQIIKEVKLMSKELQSIKFPGLDEIYTVPSKSKDIDPLTQKIEKLEEKSHIGE